ncbi:mucin-3B-like [Sus scrofa]|uniref:mucin-3B-like n=1 Tax=Sus scrofa TaxID=9823 RepID=UPI000A2B9073|nr:mucin-3B-like [Sus scrofa]
MVTKQPTNELLCSTINTGTSAMATSTSNARLRASLSSPHSKGTAGWPLSTPKTTSPTPDSRDHIPMAISTSPRSKSISKTLLKPPTDSNTSAIHTPKFVFKVETTPPTLVVYKGTTECVNPLSFTVTTTYAPTTCMTRTQVSFTSSYTAPPVTGKPQTTRTSTHPVTATKRVTSAVTNSPTITTLGKTLATTAHASSFVPTTATTLDTLISSLTGTMENTTPTAATVRTTQSPTPTVVSTSATTPSLTTKNTLMTTVTDKSASPTTSSPLITTTTSFPNKVSTFKTTTATTHAPSSTDIVATHMAPVIQAAPEATTALSAPKATPSHAMSSVKTTLISMTDIPREILTTGIASISSNMSSIIPTDTMISTTRTASKASPVPANTDAYTTSTTKGYPSTTAATTETGKMRGTAAQASSTWETTFIPTTDTSKEPLTTAITATPPIISDTPTIKIHNLTSITTRSMTTNALTSNVRMPHSSVLATTKETVPSWTSNIKPLSTLMTTTPITHATSTSSSLTRNAKATSMPTTRSLKIRIKRASTYTYRRITEIPRIKTTSHATIYKTQNIYTTTRKNDISPKITVKTTSQEKYGNPSEADKSKYKTQTVSPKNMTIEKTTNTKDSYTLRKTQSIVNTKNPNILTEIQNLTKKIYYSLTKNKTETITELHTTIYKTTREAKTLRVTTAAPGTPHSAPAVTSASASASPSAPGLPATAPATTTTTTATSAASAPSTGAPTPTAALGSTLAPPRGDLLRGLLSRPDRRYPGHPGPECHLGGGGRLQLRSAAPHLRHPGH